MKCKITRKTARVDEKISIILSGVLNGILLDWYPFVRQNIVRVMSLDADKKALVHEYCLEVPSEQFFGRFQLFGRVEVYIFQLVFHLHGFVFVDSQCMVG